MNERISYEEFLKDYTGTKTRFRADMFRTAENSSTVRTEPKIIVHPPKYGGAVETKELAVGNG